MFVFAILWIKSGLAHDWQATTSLSFFLFIIGMKKIIFVSKILNPGTREIAHYIKCFTGAHVKGHLSPSFWEGEIENPWAR